MQFNRPRSWTPIAARSEHSLQYLSVAEGDKDNSLGWSLCGTPGQVSPVSLPEGEQL